VNHDSSEATVAYLSRIFVVNDDSSPASPPAARPAGRTTRATRPGVDPEPEPAAEPGSLLEVHGVTVRFGGLTALDNVSFTAPGRQVTGVIGPNGAGKTTLLNVLCGFVRPDQGRLSFGHTELGLQVPVIHAEERRARLDTLPNLAPWHEDLQHQRHRKHLGHRRGKPVGAAHQIPHFDPRTLRLSLETLGRPGFKYNPGEPLVHLLRRHVSAAYCRIMNYHAPPADPGENDEMVVVPVQDAG